MTTTDSTTPSEDELKSALKALRTEHPTLGISKLHAALLAAHPGWTVSEKRTRKVLQSEGLVIVNAGGSSNGGSEPAGFKYPSSKVMEGLDVGKWTDKVEVRVFDRKKGKGLVAKVKIAEGETIWKEDPFVLAPEWILLANQTDDAFFRSEWDIVKSMAQLGMEERHAQVSAAEPDRATWKKAFQLYKQAFYKPTQETDNKKLARLLKKPLPEDVADELFGYDAFLRNLGRMSLNLEAHGGLYVLHSHINHTCDPNVSVRHFDQRSALSRITVVAKKDIDVGEELFITYVNPEQSRVERQRQLDEWGFGVCRCARCNADREEEAKLLKEGKAPVKESGDGQVDADLANELKAGLGPDLKDG
ncbi:SET domain-containing protein 5 [Steccherinum ochraceum]|uniref:Histone-lysine N-methyltransferase SET5 n=1 Tax=Steccherinum ochraceum TaxID=92696 RepID=A0A4R0RDT2_9APHY|nr:SET domain-containing protein 5 [Steccherinum ochraceum]